MKPIPATLIALLCLIVAVATPGCDGGGGNDGENASGPLLEDSCNVLGPKIFSGTACSVSSSPVVRITIRYLDGASFLCSGSVIGRRSVLTAGHCFPPRTAPLGDIVINTGGEVMLAQQVVISPDYFEDFDNGAIFGDLAILTTDELLSVPPLPLLSTANLGTGTVVDVFGYGVDESGEEGTLRGGQMVIDSATENHFLAIFNGDGSNTCLGDSGGPAMLRLAGADNNLVAIIGITSTGDADSRCQVGDRSLFTNLRNSSYLNFIHSNVTDAVILSR